MSGPFVYIGAFTIKSGRADEARQALRRLVAVVEANEPRVVSFNAYLDEQGTKVSVVQVHPDADSMALHMKVVANHLGGAFEYLEATESEQIFGRPTASLAALLEQWTDPGVSVTRMPIHVAGFTRTSAP